MNGSFIIKYQLLSCSSWCLFLSNHEHMKVLPAPSRGVIGLSGQEFRAIKTISCLHLPADPVTCAV